MISLRLKRMGSKKRPSYRIVAADSRSPRDGRFIESFGIYDPIANPKVLRIDHDRAKHWLSVGARPSETVHALFAKEGLMSAPAMKQRGKPKSAEAVAEAVVAAAVAEAIVEEVVAEVVAEEVAAAEAAE